MRATTGPESPTSRPAHQAQQCDDPGVLTPEDVEAVRFKATKFRDGYDQDEVDDFLDRVVAGLRARQTGEPGALTPADLDGARFTATKFREGYDMADVDEFLDRVRAEVGGSPAPRTTADEATIPAPAQAPTSKTTDKQIPGMIPQRRGLFGRRR